MHNQNNKYQYCNRDLLNNPEKYNFASFQGKKFLENYLDFRFSIVEKLENSIKMSVTFTELISNFCNQNISKENDMELENLLTKTLCEKKIKSHKLDTNIDIFLKKYEIKKRLMSQYDTEFFEKNQDYKNLRNYLLLELLCVIRYEETRHLKFLNTILKINDMLITQAQQINEQTDLSIFKYCLEFEIKFVKELCELKGLEIQ